MLSLPVLVFGALWGLDWSGVIHISWWWITAPLWGGAVLIAAILFFLTLCGVAALSVKSLIGLGKKSKPNRVEAAFDFRRDMPKWPQDF